MKFAAKLKVLGLAALAALAISVAPSPARAQFGGNNIASPHVEFRQGRVVTPYASAQPNDTGTGTTTPPSDGSVDMSGFTDLMTGAQANQVAAISGPGKVAIAMVVTGVIFGVIIAWIRRGKRNLGGA